MSLLAVETCRTVSEVAARMRTAATCGTCREAFSTAPERDRLCDECRQHFFGEPNTAPIAQETDQERLKVALEEFFGIR